MSRRPYLADGGAALLQLIHHDIETEAIRLLRSYEITDVSGHASATLKEQARRAKFASSIALAAGGVGDAWWGTFRGVREGVVELNGDEGFDGEHGFVALTTPRQGCLRAGGSAE